jgi:hypothetical protein
MQYLVAGIFVILCIIIIIFGLKVLKESKNMIPKKPKEGEDQDDEIRRLRP